MLLTGAIALTVVGGLLVGARATWVTLILSRLLPQAIEDLLPGAEVRFASPQVIQTGWLGSPFEIQLLSLEIATPGLRLEADAVRVHMRSWWALSDGADAIRDLEITTLRCVIEPVPESARTPPDAARGAPRDPAAGPDAPLVWQRPALPPALGRAPFPVRVTQWEIAGGGHEAAGTASLDPDRVMVEVRWRTSPAGPVQAVLDARWEVAEGEANWTGGTTPDPDRWTGRVQWQRAATGWTADLDWRDGATTTAGRGTVSLPDDPAAESTLQLQGKLEAPGIPPLTAHVEVRAAPDSLALAGELVSDTGRLQFEGHVDRSFRLDLAGADLRLDPLLALWFADPAAAITGVLSVQLEVRSERTWPDLAHLHVVGTVRGRGALHLDRDPLPWSFDLALADAPLPDATQTPAQFSNAPPVPTPAALAISGQVRMHEARGEIVARLDTHQVQADLAWQDLELAPLLALARNGGSGAQVAGTLRCAGNAALTGPWNALVLQLALEGGAGTLTALEQTLAIESAHLAVRWQLPGAIFIEELRVRSTAGEVTGIGAVPLSAPHRWAARFEARGVPVALAAPWVGVARDLAGQLTAHLEIDGSAQAPEVRAWGSLAGGEIALRAWERMRDVTAHFHYEQGKLTIEDLRATSGGGTLAGHGRLTFDAQGALLDQHFELELERVLLYRSPDLFARGSGRLSLAIQGTAAHLAGALRVTRGLYRRDVRPQLGNTFPTDGFELFTLADGIAGRMSYDVTLTLDGGLRVQNNRCEVAPHGTLHLQGSGHTPVLVGTVGATEGKVLLPHLTLNISHVELRFSEQDVYHPQLEFRGTGTIGEYEIEATVQGRWGETAIRFRSVPELPEEELIVLIATGRRPTELQDGFSAGDLALRYAPDMWRWFAASTGSASLQRVTLRTEPGRTIGVEDRIEVEVELLPWLSVVGERDERGDSNLDVRFFWWFP